MSQFIVLPKSLSLDPSLTHGSFDWVAEGSSTVWHPVFTVSFNNRLILSRSNIVTQNPSQHQSFLQLTEQERLVNYIKVTHPLHVTGLIFYLTPYFPTSHLLFPPWLRLSGSLDHFPRTPPTHAKLTGETPVSIKLAKIRHIPSSGKEK